MCLELVYILILKLCAFLILTCVFGYFRSPICLHFLCYYSILSQSICLLQLLIRQRNQYSWKWTLHYFTKVVPFAHVQRLLSGTTRHVGFMPTEAGRFCSHRNHFTVSVQLFFFPGSASFLVHMIIKWPVFGAHVRYMF